ncbi:MAG: SAM-dependent DNA methyltransferase [Acidobacteria bacterium]|nr:SAM-dependent DNA methyltransferase [Acidobacteriota bacterium]
MSRKTASSERQHEVTFCNTVTKWAVGLFARHPALPFGDASIEEYGQGSLQRQDLRFYERGQGTEERGRLALCGEVKLPGTIQGKSPFFPSLLEDAFGKATRVGCRYFFTWNIEHLALFDCSLWDKPLHERCIGEWKLGLQLDRSEQVTRAEVVAKLRDEFLPKFLTDFAEILTGRRENFALPPSDFYISVLETHIAGPLGPVRELRDYLSLRADSDSAFDSRLREWMTSEQQWNFDRNDLNSWREAVDRAARTMAYVLSNRILFYQAVRARNALPELHFPSTADTSLKALRYLCKRFREAVEVTGDYEPVFFPNDSRLETEEQREWAALTALSGTHSLEAWNSFITAVEKFNFKEIPSDILGGVFQKLISPEERHKFGQHYTDEDIVDVINAFCIRKAEDIVFDPACGSGSFLVRAYYRKNHLNPTLGNQILLEGLYGCDINPFPAHLATLNLAARHISNEQNYPRIARKNFFAVPTDADFCRLPTGFTDADKKPEYQSIKIPLLDAVVGNPPYVRHEAIPQSGATKFVDQTKNYIHQVAAKSRLPGDFSKQSDLHVYFWPVAAQYLREDGWFGFLTSSSWLDVRYGFALQSWILQHFRIVAILESTNEPWFEDARVKTCVTILQRCKDPKKRDDNLVRFVRLTKPIAELLGPRADEVQRQKAAEALRDSILQTKKDTHTERMRILLKKQGDLWTDGLSVAEMFERLKHSGAELEEDNEPENPVKLRKGRKAPGSASLPPTSPEGDGTSSRAYGGGKWGRYLRAPDLYFDLMREFGSRFVRLGDVATIRFGIKSGCDDFFMPRNVSAKVLEQYPTDSGWNNAPLMQGCQRTDVENGKVVIVECGDGTWHPIEAQFVRPEVHNLMRIDRPIVTPEQLDRVVLWVNQPLEELKDTLVHQFITWGSTQTFASSKSKAVPVPERATCAGRSLWYDVTGLKPGIGFWPMAQQYRHIIPANPFQLVCNHNLFDLHAPNLELQTAQALMAILNSTLVAFFKTFYGRYAGTEGNLKTEVVDVVLLEIPDPHCTTQAITQRLKSAFARMQKREVTHLLEETFRNCKNATAIREIAQLPLGLPLELQHPDRRELDDAVFELLGVADASRRRQLLDKLYEEVTRFFRAVRIVEVQKMEQRKGGGRTNVSANDLAEEAWKQLDVDFQTPLAQWIQRANPTAKTVELPTGAVRLPPADNFLESTTLSFGKKPVVRLECKSRAEVELLFGLAHEGIRGKVTIPDSEAGCKEIVDRMRLRMQQAREAINEQVGNYAGSDKMREQVARILWQWFIHGK